jgi:hypothetical protein
VFKFDNPIKQRIEWLGYLAQWDWQVHLTTTPFKVTSIEAQIAESKKYLSKIDKRFSKCKMAGYILATESDYHDIRPHTHILLVSDPSYPQQAGSIPEYMFKDLHPQPATLKVTYSETFQADGAGWDNWSIARYLTRGKNFDLHHDDSHLVEFFRLKRLKSLASRQPYRPSQNLYEYRKAAQAKFLKADPVQVEDIYLNLRPYLTFDQRLDYSLGLKSIDQLKQELNTKPK